MTHYGSCAYFIHGVLFEKLFREVDLMLASRSPTHQKEHISAILSVDVLFEQITGDVNDSNVKLVFTDLLILL